MKCDLRLARGRRLFEYHCYEGEDSSDAELWHHTHQQIVVLSKYKRDNNEVSVYKVQFSDGLEYDVFDDELVKTKNDYYRLDYIKGG